ncbi:MAG: hypothetical protein SGPRY_009940 [Prymnesium sp.]
MEGWAKWDVGRNMQEMGAERRGRDRRGVQDVGKRVAEAAELAELGEGAGRLEEGKEGAQAQEQGTGRGREGERLPRSSTSHASRGKCGKTRTLTARVSYLLHTLQYKPESILVLTFSTKARDELLARLGGKLALPHVHTFHSFCLWLLQREGASVGVPPGFRTLPEEACVRVVSCLLRSEQGREEEACPPPHSCGGVRISEEGGCHGDGEGGCAGRGGQGAEGEDEGWQGGARGAEDGGKGWQGGAERGNGELGWECDARRLYKEIQRCKRGQAMRRGERGWQACGGRGSTEVQAWSQRYTSRLLGMTPVALDFDDLLLKAYELLQQEACAKAVLAVPLLLGSDEIQLPGGNAEQLWTENSEGARVQVHMYCNEREEAESIASQIKRLLAGRGREMGQSEEPIEELMQHASGLQPSDVAVLTRTTRQLHAIEQASSESSVSSASSIALYYT